MAPGRGMRNRCVSPRIPFENAVYEARVPERAGRVVSRGPLGAGADRVSVGDVIER